MTEDVPMMDLAALVRTRDYDAYLAIHLAPRKKRSALYAVTAFESELAQIDARMSDALLAAIRFAWWREALEEIAAGATPRRHPIVLALAGSYRATPAVFVELFAMLNAYGEAPETAHTVTTERLYAAWALLMGRIVDEALSARISAQVALVEWADLIARKGFGEQDSTVSFHGFLQSATENRNDSLAFLNEKIGGHTWKIAALRRLSQLLFVAQGSWPKDLKLLGGLALIARLRAERMMRRSDSATLPAISATSPRIVWAVLRYGWRR